MSDVALTFLFLSTSIDVTTNPSTGDLDYSGELGTVKVEDDTSVRDLAREVLEINGYFLQKPFTPAELAHKVRESLDS